MIWIERVAVDVTPPLVSVQLLEPLGPTMTTAAETLEPVQPKGIHVISMRNDVINASCRLTDAISQAHLAQWLNKQLLASNTLPALCSIQAIQCSKSYAHQLVLHSSTAWRKHVNGRPGRQAARP